MACIAARPTWWSATVSVGNILLKASEGLAAMVSARIEQRFRDGLAAKLVGALALPLLRRLRGDIAPARL